MTEILGNGNVWGYFIVLKVNCFGTSGSYRLVLKSVSIKGYSVAFININYNSRS